MQTAVSASARSSSSAHRLRRWHRLALCRRAASIAIWTTSSRFISRCAKPTTATTGVERGRRARSGAAAVRQRRRYLKEQCATCGRSLRSKAVARTCATRCARCASRPASRSSRCSRSPSASAATPRSSASWTRSAPRALPYRDPDRLVQLWGNVQRARVERRGASYPDYLDWRAQSKSFEDMAAFDSQCDDACRQRRAGADPDRVRVGAVLLAARRVAPRAAARFEADEDVVAKPAQVVVLSDGLWKRRFGARSADRRAHADAVLRGAATPSSA